jgi:hypothetical protein
MVAEFRTEQSARTRLVAVQVMQKAKEFEDLSRLVAITIT